MNIQPLQGKCLRSCELAKARINIWEGSVRSGKTIGSLHSWLRFVRFAPAGNLLMFGKTERTLKRNIIDPLADYIGEKACKHIIGSGELFLLGRRVYLVGANDIKAESKVRGLTLLGAYGDEITTAPESFYSMLLTRLSLPGSRFFGTTNPDSPFHWLMRDYLSRAAIWLQHEGGVAQNDSPEALNLARFSFRLFDNPHLPEEYLKAVNKEFTGLWHKRYVQGLWVQAEGAIYDMYPGETVAAFPEIIQTWIGIDYGTANPFVALLLGLGDDSRLYVLAEYRHDSKLAGRQLTDSQYSQQLVNWLKLYEGIYPYPSRFYVDPSAASFMNQLFNDGFRGVFGADNKVAEGIRDVSSLLAGDLLRIGADCKGLNEEMVSYVWDTKAQQRGKDEPVKVNDHAPDALRYVIRGTRRYWRKWLVTFNQEEEAA